ncbi:hypothetical protein DCAR_0729087 [Daucus carota subsp. sativus]|uniref:Uncharacterized protein n=1 Tax=Daucus carota subsp. sativus TaxID=79200 RepID=A0A164U0I4_DAUCS|nr:hypothetical protein DCAR_0729087 [Daucus carota subsp. sativus]
MLGHTISNNPILGSPKMDTTSRININMKGKAVGPLPTAFRSGEVQEGNKDYEGKLPVTLVDARKLFYVFPGKTDPYVILKLGDQVIRSKKNSQTTVIGSPGEPIWNQVTFLVI